MPTPVNTARQCLTEDAARALDDAVMVARRRNHAQTTSLHAVSALLALSSSILREACSRARSSAYSPRLQFRALELRVGVSLDRLPTTKAQDEPPISNSLMAAIKRSQANQRRHPETFHLYQQLQHQNNFNINSNSNSASPPSISTLKVELKHFILSILDDPIVSRVFGEAGFRSFEIKIAILNPPTISRFSKTRCPPLFLCNLSDLELNKRGFSFPFSGVLDSESLDENSRRIGEVLVKKCAKNPLLVGVCANDALNDFTEVVKKGKDGTLPREIDGLRVICLEKEISEFLDRGGNQQTMSFKFKEVDEACKGAGLVVNYGELNVFVDDGESVEAVNYVVSQLSRLVEVHCGNLWLIGSAASYDTYMKFLAQFPSIEKDWDLHLLPITSSRPPVGRGYSKSGLMGSFVPFGGFFCTPSDFENPWNNRSQSTSRCNMCNEKYEQEASTILKGGSTVSVADHYSANLSPWLQTPECDKNKRLGIEEAKNDRSLLNARLIALETKWNDICQRLHHNWSFQQQISQTRSQVPKADAFQLVTCRSESSITDPLFDGRKFVNPSSYMPSDSQNTSLPKPNMLKPIPQDASADFLSESPVQVFKLGNFWNPSCCFHNLSVPLDQTTSSSVTSVTTDLGLGTLYTSAREETSKAKYQKYNDSLQNSGSVSADTCSENASNRVALAQSSSCSVGEQSEAKDFKYILRVLSEKVSWQDEAIYTISQTVASCRNGHGKRHCSNKGNIWLSFLGPDMEGKRRIAAALAEAIFGSTESLLRVDLGSVDKIRCSGTIFERQDVKNYDLCFRGKTMVDYIADELRKKSHSVVLLENIDKADVLVQNSLSQAIRTGKFPNSFSREISVNNIIFVTTSSVLKGCKDFLSRNTSTVYSEERILTAKDVQMQIQVESASGDGVRNKNTDVMITSIKGNTASLSAGKRKLIDGLESAENRMLQTSKRMCEATRSSFDLNLPVEEMEEDNDCNNSENDSDSESSKAWLEDFLDQVDGNVAFKPFDFDALAQKVLKEISLRFQKIFASSFLLEIESEILVQILAATWLSERKKAVENWIEEVLCRSFEEALQGCSHTSNTVNVIKLIACAGLLVEDHSPGICLPARLTMS